MERGESAISCFLVASLLIGLVAPIALTGTGAAQSGESPETDIQIEKSGSGTEYAVTITADPAGYRGIIEFGPDVEGRSITITDAGGFEESGDGRYRLSQGSGTSSISYTVSINNSLRHGIDSVRTPLLLPQEIGYQRTSSGQAQPTTTSPDISSESGTVSNDVYIDGETSTTTVERNGITVQYELTPAAADALSESQLNNTDMVSAATAGITEHATSTPDTVSYIVYRPNPDAVAVREDLSPSYHDGIELTSSEVSQGDAAAMVEEYVYANRGYAVSEGMEWLPHASAAYLSQALLLESGQITYEQYINRTSSIEHTGADLFSPDEWSSIASETTTKSDIARGKGLRVMAAVDTRVRMFTDGEQSYRTILQRIREGTSAASPLDRSDFRYYLESSADIRFGRFFGSYISGGETPPLESNFWAFTSRTDIDPDGDGVNNIREYEEGLSPFNSDTDGDGLSDLEELNSDTDPAAADTDGDGVLDGVEKDSSDTSAVTVDSDGDGLRDGQEISVYNTDPNSVDTDGDGLSDAAEATRLPSSPTDADTDMDGLNDSTELDIGTNPQVVDTDGDGLPDSAEYNGQTNATVADTDGDGYDDGREVEVGTNPTNNTDIFVWIFHRILHFFASLF